MDGYKRFFKNTKKIIMSIFNFKSKKETPILKINGVEVPFEGQSLTIEVTGDFEQFEVSCAGQVKIAKSNNFNIKVEGNVEHVSTENGTVFCENVEQNVITNNGNIKCGDIGGNVETNNGNVSCVNVTGNIKTKLGKVYSK